MRSGLWLLVAPQVGCEFDRRGRLIEESLELAVRGFLYYWSSVLADIVFQVVERSRCDQVLEVIPSLDSHTWAGEVTTRLILQEVVDKLRGKEHCYDRDYRSVVVSLRLAREGFLPQPEQALRLPVPGFVLEGFLGGLDRLIEVYQAFLEIRNLLRSSDEDHAYYALSKEGPRFGESALELVELIRVISPRGLREAPRFDQPTEFWTALDRALREPPSHLAGIAELYGTPGYDSSVREGSLIGFYELRTYYEGTEAVNDEDVEYGEENWDLAELERLRDDDREEWEDAAAFPEERVGYSRSATEIED